MAERLGQGPPFRAAQSRRASSTGAGLRPATAASLQEHTAVAPLRVAVETHMCMCDYGHTKRSV
ncbi:hypothetical protein BI024_gp02 [Streptomyces phage Nanodon]|uniref:Uncharacterized protein n=1 Tax=Streptomyces phage Nanodon TaxID=1873777 RepID=A0A1B1PAB4_9CAUD|nr:hypothetical protein BI024_gp02 [Streptomyces phage Nanodon]ANT41101.1 hypothetical protein SEA_NANODON_2 [Streptomyces phage Nanodon]